MAAWAGCGLFACVIGVQHQDLFQFGELPVLQVAGHQAGAGETKANKKKHQDNNKPAANHHKDRRFLGFELPDRHTMNLDQRQRFEIAPALSQVGVDLSTPVGSLTAKSSRISGALVVAPKQPEAEATAWLTVKTKSLSTGDRSRDAMLHDALKAHSHPEIRFNLRSFQVQKLNLQARKLTGTATCTMWICGRAQKLLFPVEAQLDPKQGLVLKGEVKLSLSKMGVEVPRTFGIPLLMDEITLWLGIRGRYLGAEPRPPSKQVADAR
jgi:polyisoprenoid-binding protein YceI